MTYELQHTDKFGFVQAHYATVIVPLVAALPGFRYDFMGREFADLLFQDRAAAAKVYWTEILARSHIAASTSILRLFKWWQAADLAITTQNFFAFAGALRAFFEAAADSYYTLQAVPITLARDVRYIRTALDGTAKAIMLNKELEDLLLHYSHASKRFADKGPKQKALRTSAYLKALQGEEYAILRACYDELCEAVHPALDSVALFLVPICNDGSRIELTAGSDLDHIGHITSTYKDGIAHAWELGFNLPLVVLAVLNRIGPRMLTVQELDRVSLDRIALWREVDALLRS